MHSIGSILQISTISSILFPFPAKVSGGFACLSNPCVHGVCLDDLNTTYSCYCIDGYTGVQCQTNWDECWSSPCQNGGICLDGIASFNCSCPPGFVGDVCEEDLNECESNPCHNNGTCLDGSNGYTCNCLPGYSGTHCEVDVAVCNATNETRCNNGGICVEGPGVTFSCKCQSGWTGFLCDVEIDECLSAPCQNGAVCIDFHADYACACLFGFAGRNCEEVVLVCEDSPCRNDALCLMEEDRPVCYCVPDYHGDRCQYQYDECQLGPRCLNGGSCIDGIDNFTCSCPPNLTGVYCECLIIDGHLLDCSYISPTPLYNYTSSINQDLTSTTELFTFVTTERTSEFTAHTTESGSLPSSSSTTHDVPNFTSTTLQSFTPTTEMPVLTTDIVTTTEIPIKVETSSSTTTEVPTSVETSSPTTPTTFTPIETSLSTSPATVLIETSTPVVDLTEPSTSKSPTTVDLTTESSTLTPSTTNLAVETHETTEISSSSYELTTMPSTLIIINVTESISSTMMSILTTISDGVETSTAASVTFPFTQPVVTTELSTQEVNTTQSYELTTSDESVYTTKEYTMSPTMHLVTEGTSVTTELVPATTSEITTVSTAIEFTTLPMSTTGFMDLTTLLTELPTTEGMEDNFTTPTTLPDCSKYENRCRNGGSCVYSNNGYQCICPFDTEGTFCEKNLGIKNAAFTGNSYLSHKLQDKTKMAIEFKAKTTSSSGLLFTSNIDQTYMALYIENGYLKFKFSCGFQTMLLSELGKPVNNGYEMRINAELTFNMDFSHCNASIKLNNTLSMSGDQLALIDRFSKVNSWLYLGGVPNEYVKERIHPGFVGCMSDLKISSKKISIFRDAEDGSEVSECSSLACLSNPCQNHGICASVGDVWHCKCKNGYLGKMCEISVCDDNPCQFGGTCLPYTGSGYICLCPFGKHGHFCENELLITKPYFSSSLHGYSSYISYPIPKGQFNRMEVKFNFKPNTMDQISVLMFIGQKGRHDFHSDHMAVSFVKGYIMLTWNLGSGPRRIFTTKPITAGKASYSIHIGRYLRRSWLYVEDLGNVTGRSPGNLIQLDVVPLIYFGGYDVQNFSTLPHDLPLHSGFSGCIYDIEFKAENIAISLESTSNAIGRALGQCGTTECYEKICQNEGACLYHGGTFTCLCQEGNYGPLCSSKFNYCDSFRNACVADSTCVPRIAGYDCDCPIGKSGKHCQKNESLTDIGFSGLRSYLAIEPVDFELIKFNIEFEMRPLKNRGLVMFIGRMDMFLSMSLLSGILELRILPGRKRLHPNELLVIRSNKLMVLGNWHSVRVGLYGRKVYLFVNNIVNTGVLQPGEVINLSEQHIYIGGLPDLSTLPNEATSFLPIPYTGCARKLIINNKRIPLNAQTIKSSRNIADCDGTPCGNDYCENAGTCWLDPNLKPHCTCVQPFYGERCEKLPKCGEKVCQNRGRCIGGYCECTVGWQGAFCEASIVVKTPKFQGNSYLLVNKLNNKKRDVRDLDRIRLNFTTASLNGVIIWTQKDDRFLGIGIENGLLKLAYTTNNSVKNIEVPDIGRSISDGLYHTLDVHFHPFNLTIDAEIIEMPNVQELQTEYLTSNNIFYLGGIPRGSEIHKEARNIFHSNFEGCVQSFGTNQDATITDFSQFEGENIGDCGYN